MIRSATHAGSWYTKNPDKLQTELNNWLQNVPPDQIEGVPSAIIGPHAGYAYSGETAAFAYKTLNFDGIKRIYLLGPSHHVYISGCAVSKCDIYETPLGNIHIDRQEIERLRDTGMFEDMSKSVDEDEHSIEMHLPYLKQVLQNRDIPVIPILVGALETSTEIKYAKFFADLLLKRENLFIISSDFCHWGSRFRYTYLPSTEDLETPIHQQIKALDYEAMEIISKCDAKEFTKYLKRTQNTICGRHPIAVLLYGVQELLYRNSINDACIIFTKYAQSNKVKTKAESSVSYAAGYLIFK